MHWKSLIYFNKKLFLAQYVSQIIRYFRVASFSIILLFVFSCKTQQKLLEQSTKPIIWGCDSVRAQLRLNEYRDGIRQPHPLDIGKYLFYTTLKYEQTKNQELKNLSFEYVDLINELHKNPEYFKNNTFLYNFNHNELKPGWWSGMANSAIILGLTYFDKVNKTNHQSIIDQLIENLSTDYREGGSLFSMGIEENWLLEYSWKGIKEESAKRVLNGFMYSLICLESANMIKKNDRLSTLFDTGINILHKELDNYFFENIAWTKYDLQPTIEPAHYAIFDIMLLESLSLLNEESQNWIVDNVHKRREILKKGYQLQIKKGVGGNYEAIFNLIGPPNPYWIDIYPIEIKLEIDGDNDRIINSFPPKNWDIEVHDRGFMSFNLSSEELKKINEVIISAKYNEANQILFSYSKEQLKNLKVDDSPLKSLPISSVKAQYDGVIRDSSIVIIPERKFDLNQEIYKNNVAQIIMTLTDSLSLLEKEHIVLKAGTSSDIIAHKFIFHTVDGIVYQRYYLPIQKGKNIFLLNTVGFPKYHSNSWIKKIIWQIYTTEIGDEVSMFIDGLWKTENNFQLREVFKDPEFEFKEKKERGNIY